MNNDLCNQVNHKMGPSIVHCSLIDVIKVLNNSYFRIDYIVSI